MPEFKNIIYEKRGHLAYVTLNREERRNAIDPATSKELLDAFTDFKSDDEVCVAILTGAGDAAFSAGTDWWRGRGVRRRRPGPPVERPLRRHHPRLRVLEADYRRDQAATALRGGLELRGAAISASPPSTPRSACRSRRGRSSRAPAAPSGCLAPCRSPLPWS